MVSTKNDHVKTVWMLGKDHTAKEATRTADEAAYLDTLVKAGKEPGAFKKFSDEASSNHLRSVKRLINKVVQQEIDLVEFKDKVSKEDLAAEAYQEVVTKENFFFKVDENKKNTNMKVYDYTAPGNKYRKPSIILPHEHVQI